MDTHVLEELGFSTAETKVYLALLELGTSKAGELIKHSGLQNSVVHMTLSRLVEKGLASFALESNVKHYSATNPQNLIRWIDEKKQRFEAILPDLLAKQAGQERQEAAVYEGVRGFKSMCYKFIEDVPPGADYLTFAFMSPLIDQDREIYSFYREFTADRLRRGLKIRGIAHEQRKPLFKELDFDLGHWIFVNFPTLQNVSVCGNKIFMTPWEHKRVSFLISSTQLADNFRHYFDAIWNEHHATKK